MDVVTLELEKRKKLGSRSDPPLGLKRSKICRVKKGEQSNSPKKLKGGRLVLSFMFLIVLELGLWLVVVLVLVLLIFLFLW